MINSETLSGRDILFKRLEARLETAWNLNRKIVSFQANKEEPIYRWFKYKEGFSSSLVKYFLNEFSKKPGKVLDPFAGAGTTLFAGQELGWEAHGIELLPVGNFVMETRASTQGIDYQKVKSLANEFFQLNGQLVPTEKLFNHISITKDAFSDETEARLEKYLTWCSRISDEKIRTLFRFAAFSVLEEISFTRKDGQYLRWDYRSKRELSGKPFDKGKIYSFDEALKGKLNQILLDVSPAQANTLFPEFEEKPNQSFPIKVISGSCLEELPKMESNSYDFVLTSPPYCNRYDYTRTYALELVFLGYNLSQVRDLRQAMLSCTVENKEKIDSIQRFYQSINRPENFETVLQVYNNSGAMTEVNSVLHELNLLEKLNNKNVPRMVKNYFLEMCFVVFELARVLKPGGHCVMVNDNVRYGGEEIPVDLILSEFAENFGFDIKKILVLPKGKGNSSQQMGNYGRTEVRKCVYLWQKI